VQCKTCEKLEVDCVYEKSRGRVSRERLLEQRVGKFVCWAQRDARYLWTAELEAIVAGIGGTLPSTAPEYSSSLFAHLNADIGTSGRSPSPTALSQNQSTPSLSSPQTGEESPWTVRPGFLSEPQRSETPKTVYDIVPQSELERALISWILPHAPFLSLPLHPQRFLTLVALPPLHPQRPHPALMYVLFAEAVRIIELDVAAPSLTSYPYSPHSLDPMPEPCMDRSDILRHVGGSSVDLLERARLELDAGIRTIDRPFDLVRASIGIARRLYAMGWFVDGWNVPVSRLLVSCGLHRNEGIYIPPFPQESQKDTSGSDCPSSEQYCHFSPLVVFGSEALPKSRGRTVIIPPANDEIDVSERLLTSWAARAQDWAAAVSWGWTAALTDTEYTPFWPRGNGALEVSERNLSST